ncbi:MAG: glycoside hydrolase family 3 C-terminal domain-containing protein [Oscillospiraceae bacterium]|nr:glycoside hydrolase family 3 C-terminal domain-containing protein [Oscillospiraceae bacterium]
MKKRTLSIAVSFMLLVTAIGWSTIKSDPAPLLPYQDVTLSFEERAVDLVSRMTLIEKSGQMLNNAPAIPRLNIPRYDYWGEALHGIARQGAATSFPSPFSMAASWNADLLYRIGAATSDEAWGMIDRINKGNYYSPDGRGAKPFLSFWSPTINLSRDPRWGRNEESFSEDPFLTAVMGERFVDGMQGISDGHLHENGEQYIKTIPCLKHYAANNSEFNRYWGDSAMDDTLLRNYYTWAFREITLRTPVKQVMSAYNRVNGVPSTANALLLDTLLRKTWGFGGFVVNDCGGIPHVYREGYHNYVDTETEAAALSVLAGTDLECNAGVIKDNIVKAIGDEIDTELGVLTEDNIDRALVRMFTARMATGEFDLTDSERQNGVTLYKNPYADISEDVVESEENLELAKQAAEEALVLLKNEDDILPLDREQISSIAVYGPLAAYCEMGDYSSTPTETVSFKQGMEQYLDKTDTQIEFYDGLASGGGSPQYVGNFRSIIINGQERLATTANSTVLMGRENDNNGPTFVDGVQVSAGRNNLSHIENGAYAEFQGVDTREGLSVKLIVSNNGNHTAEAALFVGSLDMPAGTVKYTRTAGWQNYVTVEIDIPGNPAAPRENERIFIVFSGAPENAAAVVQSDIDRAADADAAIVFVGTSWHQSTPAPYRVASEGRDRSSTILPNNQATLINAVAAKNPNTIVIIQAVGYVDVSQFHANVKAIIYSSFNGQYQGTAAANILFGDANPSARLTATWYMSDSQMPAIGDYHLKPDESIYRPGRTYMYFEGNPIYPFGYGLSYSKFEFGGVNLNKTLVAADESFNIIFDITNRSGRAGSQVTQVYIQAPDAESHPDIPLRQLKGFAKTEVPANDTVRTAITLNAEDFGYVRDQSGSMTVLPGDYKIFLGSHSNDPDMIETTVHITAADPKLRNVTLTGQKIHIIVGAETGSDLTYALTDDTLFGEYYITEPTPGGKNLGKNKGVYNTFRQDAVVAYSSNRETVATVDQNGVVTGTGGGVATITASVTIDGVTKTGSFAIAVEDRAYLSMIKVDGRNVEEFAADSYEYYVALPNEYEGLPVVTAEYPDAMDSVTVTQATDIPGSANVRVTKGDNRNDYVIRFRREDGPSAVVATFKAMEKTWKPRMYETGSGDSTMIFTDWINLDGFNQNNPVDLHRYNPDKLYLSMNLKLSVLKNTANVNMTDPDGVDFQNLFAGASDAFIRLNTVPDPPNNFYQWTIDQGLGIEWSENEINIPVMIPLGGAMRGQLGYGGMRTSANNNDIEAINWGNIRRMNVQFSSTQYRDPIAQAVRAGTMELAMTLSDVKIEFVNPIDTIIPGDLDDDGQVTVKDIIMVRDYILGQEHFDEQQRILADVNDDGVINIFDMLVMRNIILR